MRPGIKAAKAKGFAVNVNATVFDGHPAEEIAGFLDFTDSSASASRSRPATPMRRARPGALPPRRKTKELFRNVFALGKARTGILRIPAVPGLPRRQSGLPLHAMGHAERNIFGWQKPCYLLGEGYAKTFKELMETTDWDSYGTGRYEKCANCMAHCGYEPTAADALISIRSRRSGWRWRGVKTKGPMAPEIAMENQRPAQYVFDSQVQLTLSQIRANEAREKAAKAAQTSASAA